MAEIPDLKPLFPLPNVVLFPRVLLPLHVFEPRYRLMMDEVLKGDQTLCMALLKPGWEGDYYGSPPVHEIGCVGRVVQHQLLPDGRYNVTLQGERKVVVEGFEREAPYRVARLRPAAEDRAWAKSADAETQVGAALSLFRRIHETQGAAIEMAQVFGAPMDPEAILNTIATHLNVEPAVKQRLLELDQVDERFRAVYRYLQDSARTQDVIDRVRHLYPGDRRQN